MKENSLIGLARLCYKEYSNRLQYYDKNKRLLLW